jgi:hypothetical protein
LFFKNDFSELFAGFNALSVGYSPSAPAAGNDLFGVIVR